MSTLAQIIAEVEQLKTTIAELNTVIAESKLKQKEVDAECARIDKEMKEFANNRDSKLNEIKVRGDGPLLSLHGIHGPQGVIKSKKAEVAKQSKTYQGMQRDQQTNKLELGALRPCCYRDLSHPSRPEQLEVDIKSAEKSVVEAQDGLVKLQADLTELEGELEAQQVRSAPFPPVVPRADSAQIEHQTISAQLAD